MKKSVLGRTFSLFCTERKICAAEEKPPTDQLAQAIRPILSKHFKPALLARMTIVPYVNLDSLFMQEIVKLKLDRLAVRMVEANKIKLH